MWKKLLLGIIAASACALIVTVWGYYSKKAESLGFAGLYERFLASNAGFADDASGYHQFLESDLRQRQIAGEIRDERARRDAVWEDAKQAPQRACFAAQIAVEKRLQNPQLARFPSCLEYPGHVTLDGPNQYPPTKFLVHSWVELPDGSGILRQHGYEASVEHDVAEKLYRTNILSLR